jgi:hypothetical protein
MFRFVNSLHEWAPGDGSRMIHRAPAGELPVTAPRALA